MSGSNQRTEKQIDSGQPTYREPIDRYFAEARYISSL